MLNINKSSVSYIHEEKDKETNFYQSNNFRLIIQYYDLHSDLLDCIFIVIIKRSDIYYRDRIILVGHFIHISIGQIKNSNEIQ